VHAKPETQSKQFHEFIPIQYNHQSNILKHDSRLRQVKHFRKHMRPNFPYLNDTELAEKVP